MLAAQKDAFTVKQSHTVVEIKLLYYYENEILSVTTSPYNTQETINSKEVLYVEARRAAVGQGQ